jgi:aspartyl-tRNA(Asn)/glutamyl-tRNA(Gln) amidotransferase subunit C
MAEITLEEVAHVASLARLELSAEELSRLRGELAELLGYVDKIRRLDTKGVPPTAHPLPLHNVLRDDVPGGCLSREEALASAPRLDGVPQVEDDRFLVPRILGGEP